MIPQIPYVPSPDERLDTIFRLIQVIPGQKFADLGSGDGRIVIAMAEKGLEAHGYEILEKYVRRSKFFIAQKGLQHTAFIHATDFWQEDLSEYDILYIYPMKVVLDELSKKLTKEVKKDAIVITNGFEIPGWSYLKSEDHIFVYKKTS